ncbi:MAG TPA: MFS transporter [Trebonia sp.]|jgi:MFS family permease
MAARNPATPPSWSPRALGFYGATSGISTVVGQLAGGLLIATDPWGLSWRLTFLVNVPIGLAGLLLVRRTVPDSRAESPLRIDRYSTVMVPFASGPWGP